jgi:hypothetical protein
MKGFSYILPYLTINRSIIFFCLHSETYIGRPLDGKGAAEKKDRDTGGGGPGIRGDETNILVLLFLYILQGIPLGLAAAIPLILTNRNVRYCMS